MYVFHSVLNHLATSNQKRFTLHTHRHNFTPQQASSLCTPLVFLHHDSCAVQRAIYTPRHPSPTLQTTYYPHSPPLLDDAALIPPRFMLSAFTTHGASDDDSPRRGFDAVPPSETPLLYLEVPLPQQVPKLARPVPSSDLISSLPTLPKKGREDKMYGAIECGV